MEKGYWEVSKASLRASLYMPSSSAKWGKDKQGKKYIIKFSFIRACLRVWREVEPSIGFQTLLGHTAHINHLSMKLPVRERSLEKSARQSERRALGGMVGLISM